MDNTNSYQDSDENILRQIKEGRAEAFDVLFDKYWKVAYSAAYKRLKNREDSMDVVQEIFIHIWVKRQTLSIECVGAYLHVAIRNKVLKIMAKGRLSHSFFNLLQNVPVSSGADEDLLSKEFSRAYEVLLTSLPPKRQQIFRLRYHEDLSTREISDRLGIALKTVQNQLGKAVDSLKVDLQRLLTITGLLLMVI